MRKLFLSTSKPAAVKKILLPPPAINFSGGLQKKLSKSLKSPLKNFSARFARRKSLRISSACLKKILLEKGESKEFFSFINLGRSVKKIKIHFPDPLYENAKVCAELNHCLGNSGENARQPSLGACPSMPKRAQACPSMLVEFLGIPICGIPGDPKLWSSWGS